MAYDEGNVFYSYQHYDGGQAPNDGRAKAKDAFREFIKSFYLVDNDEGRNQKLIYRDALRMWRDKLLIDLHHIKNYDPDIGELLETQPAEYLPLLEAAALEVLIREERANPQEAAEGKLTGVHVMLKSSTTFGPKSIRDLTSDRMSKLVMIPGIVTAASRPKHKATHITLQCTQCRANLTVPCRPGLGGAMIPRSCQASATQSAGENQDCGLDPYAIVPDKSVYVDQQTLKLQERPEDVPTGELPRSVLMVVDRKLVSQVTPGTRVTAIGIYSAYKATRPEKGGTPLQQPYIRVVGLQQDDGDSRNAYTYTPQEEQEYKEYAKQPQLHKAIFGEMAPQIYGHDAIKKAIACLLFGGSRKQMPDGTWRRGDINVLLLGDPSTAKSQFLKFAAKVAPIAVYTSGKGSSAAGLTATVVQDSSSREFYLEGGAMVLADNGVCCIDEFDKMRPEDRVAIHEAMEQQTISIAKAGITTMLKSRTSVLAAANPPTGRYDDLRSASDNIDLQSTILSRFDLIFIVRDELTAETDKLIARHVLDVHSRATKNTADEEEEQRKTEFLKRYIHFCRTRCFPRLTEAAASRLQNVYVKMRGEARKVASELETDTPPVPMTVRQLEALVRLSESLARMQLAAVVTEEHVEMALELFNTATMQALKSGITQHVTAAPHQLVEMHRIEEKVRRVLAINQSRSERQIVEQLVGWNENENSVRRAMALMVQNQQLQYRSERRIVKRLK